MHHITWIDLREGTVHDDLYQAHTKAMIEHYESMGMAQILNVKEEVK